MHAINQLKEKCRDCNIPLCIAFMDYGKAFESVQTQAILTALQKQGIEDVYIEIMKNIYPDSSVTVHLHKEIEKIRIKRGVRQGDTISTKLFTATLESIFRRLNWENKGLEIDGEFSPISALLMTYSYAQKHHKNYNRCYKNYPMKVGDWVLIKMNIAKTKVMVVDNTPINVNNVPIENVEGYIYTWDNATASKKTTRTDRYNEESWPAGRHTLNTGISSKATKPSL